MKRDGCEDPSPANIYVSSLQAPVSQEIDAQSQAGDPIT